MRRVILRPGKEVLVNLYLNEQRSIKELSRVYSCHCGVIRRWLKYYGIPKRSYAEAIVLTRAIQLHDKEMDRIRANPQYIEAARQRMVERYKSPEERRKVAQYTRETYLNGKRDVEANANHLRAMHGDKELMAKRSITYSRNYSDKTRRLMHDKMVGLWANEDFRKQENQAHKKYWASNPNAVNHRQAMMKGMRINPNKPETAVQNVLDTEYPHEWKYVGNGEVFINGYNPDFINVNGHKYIIEVFGDYWHGKKARTEAETEQGRQAVFAKYGYRTLVIWESETKDTGNLLAKIKGFCEAIP